MGARILFVTGKGGTGKSSIASGLAREAVARGERTLLVRMASSGDVVARGGEDSSQGPEEITLDAERDLEGFLTRVLGLSFLARRLQDSRTFSAVAAAAPGLHDLVALTGITTRARRRRGLVVVDAPASGHSLPMLTAPARVHELAPFGPVAREAAGALRVLDDPRAFCAVLVTTPEELAITETRTLRGEVLAAGVRSCRVVVNGLWPAYVSAPDGEAIEHSQVSPDATMHWRRRRRQLELVDALEQQIGSSARICFAFAQSEGALPSAEMAALYDQLAESGEAAA